MKIVDSRKYLGSFIAAIALSISMTGCGESKVTYSDKKVATIEENKKFDSYKIESEDVVLEEEYSKSPKSTGKNLTLGDNTTNILYNERIPDIKDYSGNSLYEALSSVGFDTDKVSLGCLAAHLRLGKYTGSEDQNKQMLVLLKEFASEIKRSKDYDSSKITPDGDWQLYDEDKEVRLTSDGKVEFRKHRYTGFTPVAGKNYDERTCVDCGHTQHRVYPVTQKSR